jgi:hypothetical protein
VFGWLAARENAPIRVIASAATFFALGGILILLIGSTCLVVLMPFRLLKRRDVEQDF